MNFHTVIRSRSIFVLLALFPTSLTAQFDPQKTPIELPPLARYNGSQLAPVAVIGDNSDFDSDNFLVSVGGGQSFYQDLDVAGGLLFAAAGRTFEVYDITPIPSAPNRPRARIRAQATLPFWGSGDNGGSLFLNHIRAADENLVALGMSGQGFSVWKSASSSSPRVAYQDRGVLAKQLHIVSRNGVHWAYVADAGSNGGLMLYNLSNAESLDRCLDDTPLSTPCAGVFQREIGNHPGIRALAGAGTFVAIVPPGLQARIEVYDATSPAQPLLKLTGGLASAPESVTDIALWQSGDSLHLAALGAVTSTGTSRIKLFDITCATTAGTCSLPAPLATVLASDPSGGNQSTLSASSSGGRHFLYVGNHRRSGCRPQREFLFEVTRPSAPNDLSPAVDAAGYWGWYYMDCATGFNNIRPVRGYVFGDTFYRSAHSGLDAHRLVGAPPPPVSRFSCAPENPSIGETVTCTDTSTGSPDQWSWTFEGGAPSSSATQNPSVTWSDPGTKQVTLVASNAGGPSANTATQLISVDGPVSGTDIFDDGFESGATAAWSSVVQQN